MGEVPVGAIVGVLVGLMVVVVAALALVLLVVVILRKRQKHEVDSHERTPTYRGTVYLLSSHHQALTNRLCTRVHMWVGGWVNVKTL